MGNIHTTHFEMDGALPDISMNLTDFFKGVSTDDDVERLDLIDFMGGKLPPIKPKRVVFSETLTCIRYEDENLNIIKRVDRSSTTRRYLVRNNETKEETIYTRTFDGVYAKHLHQIKLRYNEPKLNDVSENAILNTLTNRECKYF